MNSPFSLFFRRMRLSKFRLKSNASRNRKTSGTHSSDILQNSRGKVKPLSNEPWDHLSQMRLNCLPLQDTNEGKSKEIFGHGTQWEKSEAGGSPTIVSESRVKYTKQLRTSLAYCRGRDKWLK